MNMSIIRYPFSLFQKIMEYVYCKQTCSGWVFVFHDVYNDDDERKTDYSISTSRFVEFIGQLQNLQGVQLRDYSSVLKMDCNEYMISFDDVYRSAYENAIPILREKSLPYTVFIATSLIDKPEYVSSEDVQCLRNDPLCTIGAHSVNHGFARFDQKGFINEVQISESELNSKVFAYPYGSVFAVSHRNCKDIARKSATECAFSTLNVYLSSNAKKHRFFLPRVTVTDSNYKDVLSQVMEKMRG